MSIQSIVYTSCFKGIDEALSGKPSHAINDFLDLLLKENENLSVVGNPVWEDWRLYHEVHETNVLGESLTGSEIWENFVKEKNNRHKYVVLRDKVTGALTFFFVFNYPDTDFGSLAMYAGVVCTSDQYRAVDGVGQLDQVLAVIMTADSAKKQFDWIGYGHFWLNTFDGKDQLRLDYKYPVLCDENAAYWHEGLSEVVRDSLANLFGIYVAMDFTLRRQSSPNRSRVQVNT